VEGHVSERAREHPGFAELLRQVERVTRTSFADGNVAE
jgi:hypothetical protein